MGAVAGDSDTSAGLLLICYVHSTGGIVSDAKHRQPRRTPCLGEMRFDLSLKTTLHGLRQCLAIQTQGHALDHCFIQHASRGELALLH